MCYLHMSTVTLMVEVSLVENKNQNEPGDRFHHSFPVCVCMCLCVHVCQKEREGERERELERDSPPSGVGLDLRGLLCFLITWTNYLGNTHTRYLIRVIRAVIIGRRL